MILYIHKISKKLDNFLIVICYKLIYILSIVTSFSLDIDFRCYFSIYFDTGNFSDQA